MALPHEGFVETDEAEESVKKFIENAIGWLAKKAEVKIATDRERSVIKHKESIKILAPNDLAANKEINVYYTNMYTQFDEESIKAIQDFIENGGGLLIAGHCHPCQYSNVKPLDHPGNKYKIE